MHVLISIVVLLYMISDIDNTNQQPTPYPPAKAKHGGVEWVCGGDRAESCHFLELNNTSFTNKKSHHC
jgi:hypothetical protein